MVAVASYVFDLWMDDFILLGAVLFGVIFHRSGNCHGAIGIDVVSVGIIFHGRGQSISGSVGIVPQWARGACGGTVFVRIGDDGSDHFCDLVSHLDLGHDGQGGDVFLCASLDAVYFIGIGIFGIVLALTLCFRGEAGKAVVFSLGADTSGILCDGASHVGWIFTGGDVSTRASQHSGLDDYGHRHGADWFFPFLHGEHGNFQQEIFGRSIGREDAGEERGDAGSRAPDVLTETLSIN